MLLEHSDALKKFSADFYTYKTDYGETEIYATHVFVSVDAINQLIGLAYKDPSLKGAFCEFHMHTFGGVFELDSTMFSDELVDKRCVNVVVNNRTFSCDRIFTINGAYANARDLLKYIDWCISNKNYETAIARIREFVSELACVPEVKPVQHYIKL